MARAVDELVWPAGEHPFRLGIGELRALEQRCDAGSATIMMRLLTGGWRIDDVIATLRLGLVGGGMDEKTAQKTVDSALEVASPYTLSVTAADVIRRAIMWDGEDQPGEAKAEAGEAADAPHSATDVPGGPTITEPELF